MFGWKVTKDGPNYALSQIVDGDEYPIANNLARDVAVLFAVAETMLDLIQECDYQVDHYKLQKFLKRLRSDIKSKKDIEVWVADYIFREDE